VRPSLGFPVFQRELLFIKVLLRFGLQIRLMRSEIHRMFQAIEIVPNLSGLTTPNVKNHTPAI
jgi:hypothetical protein